MNSAASSKSVVAPPADGPKRPPLQTSVWRGFLPWAASLFLLGMGVKLSLMHRCINSLPYYDQWKAEGASLYQLWLTHTLHFSDLFRPHGEHRIFLTNIYNLALLVLNRQWDPQVQMVFNALIDSATIAGFAWFMAALMGRRYWPMVWAAMAVALLSLFNWQNALWGFQSQFYFLLLFSLMTIALLSAEPLTRRWSLGLMTGSFAILSMASGLLPFVAIGALLVLEIWKNPRDCPNHLRALGFCAAFAFAGLLMVGTNDNNKIYAAHSLGQFFTSLGKNLVWPITLSPWLVPLNLFPLLLFAWVFVRSRAKPEPLDRIILALGVLIILQSIGTAIMRGIGGQGPISRYMDTLGFLFIANLFSAVMLLGKYRDLLRFPRVISGVLFVWLVCCVCGLYTINKFAYVHEIPDWARFQRTRVALTREFLATDNGQVFGNRDVGDVPWFNIFELVPLLRSTEIRSILPACARLPLKVTPKDTTPSIFVPGGAKLDQPDPKFEFCLGSYLTNGAPATGTFESAPMESSLPYLEFPVAGNLGQPGLSLQLVELESGKTFDIIPLHVPGGQWVNVDVKAPQGRFKLIARDESSTGWFAFRPPSEMGRLSFWAQKIVGTANYFFVGGFLSLALAVFFRYFDRRHDTA